MANADRPNGFTPVKHLDGSPFNGKVSMYLCQASNAIYVGDPVKFAGSAGAAGVFVNGVDCEGMADIDRAAAGNTVCGVVVGFLPLQSDLSLLYKAADSTKRIALVADAPDIIFEVQEDSDANNIAVTAVGNNFDMITWAAGNNSSGRSIMEIDSSDASGTATATWRVVGLAQKPDNALGNYAKWHVVANEHSFKSTTGT